MARSAPPETRRAKGPSSTPAGDRSERRASPPAASLRRALSVALDEGVGVGSRTLHLLARPSARTFAEAEIFRGESLERMFPKPGAAPEVSVTRRWSLGPLAGEDLSFRAEHEPLSPGFRARWEGEYRSNQVASARRVRFADGRLRPTLLYLHGWLQPETPFEEVAILAPMALRLGMDVVHLQPPYHGRRRPVGSRFGGELYFTADVVRTIEALRQNVAEARALVSWLLDEGHGPVGVTGLSMGGVLTLALLGLDDRFAFGVPMVAHLDLGAVVADAPALAPMRNELARLGSSPYALTELMGSFGWNDLVPQIATERILGIAARFDRFFRPAKVRALFERWGSPPVHWFDGGHMEIAFHLWDAIGRLRRLARSLGIAAG